MDAENRQPQTEASTSGSLMDTASSLRAAALLSRKRRKVATESLPRPTLKLQPSLQLDYGQEDPTSAASHPTSTDTKPPSQPLTGRSDASTGNQTSEMEDGQREEGEISDNEASPATHPHRRTPTPPARISPRTSTTQSHHKNDTAPLPLSQHCESDEASPPEAIHHVWSAGIRPSNEPFLLEPPAYRFDVSHVRPGLTMTQDQYDTAKDIVLDLLGWGVPPEYLVDCGLSRQIIFYVFTEFKLRLPSNLETSDLVPYPTPEVQQALAPASPSLSAGSRRSLSTAMPPPSNVPVRGSLTDPTRPDQVDNSMSSPTQSPKVKTEPTSPSPGDLSLLAIERQRRQELLARKAAIASRRVRYSEQGDVTSGRDLGLNIVPSQFVDDFLKTIESAHPMSPNEDDHDSAGIRSPERMDVDDAIPSLIGSRGDSILAGPFSPQTVSTTLPGSTRAEPDSPAIVPLSEPLNDTASRDRPSALTASPDMVVDRPIPNKQPSLDTDSGNPYRRGSKRPVAADFVDFDSGLGPSRSHGGAHSFNGYANGGSQLLKRKTGSFAGVSGMRRCVIELSDSEDDGDSKLLGYSANGNGREYSPTIVGRHPSRPTPTPTPPVTSFSGIAATAPAGASAFPSALIEKEEEIKKMRQLIAEREEKRLRKLAAMPGNSTPVEASVRLTTIKQEDTSPTSLGSEDPGGGRPISNATEEYDVSKAADFSPRIDGPSVPGPKSIEVKRNLLASETTTIGHETSAQDGESDDDQDLLIAGEASATEVVSFSRVESQQPPAAGDCGLSSSAQVLERPRALEEDSSSCRYSSYDSPLAAHPLLRSRLETDIDRSRGSSCVSFTSHPASSHSSIPMYLLDLKPLKQAVLQRMLSQLTAHDPGLRVCQYEVPGGGVCRDQECDELHLSRVTNEPSDAELAAYVHGTLSRPWQGRCDRRAIEIALEGVRLRGDARDTDTVVHQALAGLGIATGDAEVTNEKKSEFRMSTLMTGDRDVDRAMPSVLF